MKKSNPIAFAIAYAVVVLLFTALFLWICWNMVMPDVFGLPAIGYVQAVFMLLVSNVLFKSAQFTPTKDKSLLSDK